MKAPRSINWRNIWHREGLGSRLRSRLTPSAQPRDGGKIAAELIATKKHKDAQKGELIDRASLCVLVLFCGYVSAVLLGKTNH